MEQMVLNQRLEKVPLARKMHLRDCVRLRSQTEVIKVNQEFAA